MAVGWRNVVPGWRAVLTIILLVAAGWQLVGGSWVLVKAKLAYHLIDDAWESQLAGGNAVKPWPWADTWPVAQLLVAGRRLPVMAGTSGQALAFGAGLLEGSAEPGGSTTTVIAAHRDTHFAGLAQLRLGSIVAAQNRRGIWHSYRVVATRVVDSRKEQLPLFDQPGLLLVTCYPFDALAARGPLRYLVYAVPEPAEPSVLL